MDLYGIGQCIFFKKFFCGVKLLAANSAFFCGKCWWGTECKGDLTDRPKIRGIPERLRPDPTDRHRSLGYLTRTIVRVTEWDNVGLMYGYTQPAKSSCTANKKKTAVKRSFSSVFGLPDYDLESSAILFCHHSKMSSGRFAQTLPKPSLLSGINLAPVDCVWYSLSIS